MTKPIKIPPFANGSLLCAVVLLAVGCSPSYKKAWTSADIFPHAEAQARMTTLDVNGDGRTEWLISGIADPEDGPNGSMWILFWQPAPDGPSIIKVRVPDPLGSGQTGARCVWASGDQRFLISAPSKPTGRIFLQPIPADPTAGNPEDWSVIEWETPPLKWSTVTAVDLDNDGADDPVLGATSATGPSPLLAWMIDLNAVTTTPSPHPLANRVPVSLGEAGSVCRLLTDDVDGDGDYDLIVIDDAVEGSSLGSYWLENPWPEETNASWKRNFIGLSGWRPHTARLADLNADKRHDLLMAFTRPDHSNRLVCFQKLAAGGETSWLPIPFPLTGPQGSLADAVETDINADGYPDLVIGFSDAAQPLHQLRWLKNPGDSGALGWQSMPLSGPAGNGITLVFHSDLNGNGLIDIAAWEPGRGLVWYANPGRPSAPQP